MLSCSAQFFKWKKKKSHWGGLCFSYTLFISNTSEELQAVAAVHAGLLKLLSEGFVCLYECYCWTSTYSQELAANVYVSHWCFSVVKLHEYTAKHQSLCSVRRLLFFLTHLCCQTSFIPFAKHSVHSVLPSATFQSLLLCFNVFFSIFQPTAVFSSSPYSMKIYL